MVRFSSLLSPTNHVMTPSKKNLKVLQRVTGQGAIFGFGGNLTIGGKNQQSALAPKIWGERVSPALSHCDIPTFRFCRLAA
jgi:hypothetical protein